jgi:hypothetical protein
VEDVLKRFPLFGIHLIMISTNDTIDKRGLLGGILCCYPQKCML